MSKKPTSLFIMVLTTVTIIFWIAYEVYLVFTTETPSSIDPKILEPLNPTLDTETLENLNQRMYFDIEQETQPPDDEQIESDEQENDESIEVTPTATVTPEPENEQ